MNSVKLFAGVLAAVALSGVVSTAQADEQLVLEEVVVTAKAPARRVLEHVVVIAELPEHLRAEKARLADEPFETVLAIEHPNVDVAGAFAIHPARPTLSL